MTRYTEGARIEYKLMEELTLKGAKCMRSAGSHGVIDVAAFFPDETWLVQCKRCSKPFNIKDYKDDLFQLRLLKVSPNCRKFLYVWQKNKGWVEQREIIDGY